MLSTPKKVKKQDGTPQRPDFDAMLSSLNNGNATLATGKVFVKACELYVQHLEAQIPPAGVVTPVVEVGPTFEQRLTALEKAVFPAPARDVMQHAGEDDVDGGVEGRNAAPGE